MKKALIIIILIIAVIYLAVCVVVYFNQEKFIFIPEKLPSNYQFQFQQSFEEITILSTDAKKLNGLLFKAESSRGLFFYLHGNAGSLQSWGQIAPVYTNLGYDIFFLDYRGYGKSEGEIQSEKQFFEDVELAYKQLCKTYNQQNIIVLGYSIGTGAATQLAATNQPKMLILQAPYYNLADLVKQYFAIFPTLLLKYKFATNEYLKNCKMPVVIFHGDQDEVISYNSSLKLKAHFKETDTLFTLKGEYHNGITQNPSYLQQLSNILK